MSNWKLEDLLKRYPDKKIKPFDGMTVTASVWDEAHQYHNRVQELHNLFGHGAGILTGLDVIASDPPDTSLYILPGVAVDGLGRTIVLPQAVAYDIGREIEGTFILVLNYGESQPRSEASARGDGSPLYIRHEFSISVQTTPGDDEAVELARVWRSRRDSVFLNARDPLFPGPDEIDLRFRRQVGAWPDIRVAVSYVGDVAEPRQGRGMTYLAQQLNFGSHYRVWVEDNVALGPGIVGNALVYLVGQGPFELSAGVMNGLRNYIYRGKGTLFLESLDEAAEESFREFLAAKDIKVEAVERGHPILSYPHFFAAPPAGYPTEAKPRLEFGEGVILSPNNYGMVWQGERRGRLASREEIRAAVELGANIVAYAAERHRTRTR
ncbi:MAG: DUF4159 domain-containing protein [Chloroflexi bacterium]|nr:MAG: DUF4159 domain-containing protein [Chloroflexota bacterium]